MTKSLLTSIALLVMAGCPADEPGNLPESSWAVGAYVAPPYHADGEDKPLEGLNVERDGTWTHTDGTVVDREDTWTADRPGSLYLGDNHVPIEPNCRIIIFEGRAYFRSDAVPACAVKALTPLEYCLVGRFRSQRDSGLETIVDEYELQEDRFYRYRFDRESSSDRVEFTNVRFWSIEHDQLVINLDETDELIDLTPGLWADFEAMRVGPRHPRCQGAPL